MSRFALSFRSLLPAAETLGALGGKAPRVLASPWGMTLAVGVLLGLHLALHAWVYTGLPRDELESVFWGQGWALGYDRQQPPLHNWIALALQEILGASPAVYGLIREVQIALSLWLVWLIAREASGGDRFAGGVAVLGLLASVLFGMQMMINLTHSLTLVTATLFTLWTLVRLGRPGAGPLSWVLVGVALGLGALSKYSFALFALALLAAAMTHPVLRGRIVQWRHTLPALAIPLVMAGPHLVWQLTRPRTLTDDMPELVGAPGGDGGTDLLSRLTAHGVDILRNAWADPVVGAGTVLLLAAVLAPAILPVKRWRGDQPLPESAPEDPGRPWRRFLWVYMIVAFALASMVVLAFGGTRLREHYLMPAALAVPLWTALRLSAIRPPEPQRRRFALGLTLTATLIGGGVLVNQALLRSAYCDRCLTERPVGAMVDDVRAAGFEGGTIVASQLDWGSNLLGAFPGSALQWTEEPDHRPLPPEATAGTGCLLLVDPRRPEESWAAIRRHLIERLGGDAAALPESPDALTEMRHPVRGPLDLVDPMSMIFTVYPEGLGSCS